MGLRNVSDIFDYVSDSLSPGYNEWVDAWRDFGPSKYGNSSLFKEADDGYTLYIPQEVEVNKSFSLPEKADPETLEAKMEKGMLSITVQKRLKDKQKTLKIT